MAKTICVLSVAEAKDLQRNIDPDCKKHEHITKLLAMEWTGKGDTKFWAVPLAKWVGPDQIILLTQVNMRGMSCKYGEHLTKAVKQKKDWALAMLATIRGERSGGPEVKLDL